MYETLKTQHIQGFKVLIMFYNAGEKFLALEEKSRMRDFFSSAKNFSPAAPFFLFFFLSDFPPFLFFFFFPFFFFFFSSFFFLFLFPFLLCLFFFCFFFFFILYHFQKCSASS